MKNRRNIVEQKYPPENPNDIWLKDGKFYHSTSEGWTVIDSEMEYTNEASMIADKPKGGIIGIDKETGKASIYNDVAKQWSPLSGDMNIITWQELKNKRDAGKLTPGSLYRITDYQCTTTQTNTQSAGHQFDIVLLALSENKLAEEGWAMHHANDTYFANSNLSAWKVWYCLDNDTARFAWADDSVDEDAPAFITFIGEKGEIYTLSRDSADDLNNLFAWKEDVGMQVYTASQTPSVGDTIYGGDGIASVFTVNSYTPAHEGTGLPNGKGVIYRLIDEWNNDVPYDFKNILIYNKTYSQYCYAIIDNTENNFDVDPTLDGTKVKAIHVLCDNNDELKPIAKGGFGNNPLVNVIFLNNNTLADEYSNCIVSNGLPIVS